MSISAEEKVCYLREAAIVLAKEGFQLDEVHTDRLCILLDGAPLCEVTENGGITYRNEDINEPERVAAKDMVYEIVRNTAEYMRQMETAPFLKADGLEDGYKVLADFNGTVLAGVQSKHGVHFVTWEHRSMSWALFHGELCRSQTGLCYPLRADSKGTAFHPRADDRDLSLLCGLCRRRFLRTHGRAGKNDPQCSAADRGVCAGSGRARPSAGGRTGTSLAGADNVISNGTGRSLNNKIPALFSFQRGVRLCRTISCETRRCRRWSS